MCAPGPYMLGSVAVELRDDDRVTLRGGDRLAGSSLRMDRAIGNVMSRAGISLAQAVTMASTNPARVGRVPGRLRALQPGSRADLVRFRMDSWPRGNSRNVAQRTARVHDSSPSLNRVRLCLHVHR